MRADIIMLACGAVALVLYLAGQAVPAAVAVSIGVAVLVWAVVRRH
jgi:hypothetical protein